MKSSTPLFAVVSIFFFCALIAEAKRKTSGKLSYEINWAGGIKVCDDVEQDLLNLDNVVIEKESATGTVLGGSFDIINEIQNGTEACAYVNKFTDQGTVLATVMKVDNICNHVADEDKPWTIVFDVLNLDPRSCPIPVKNFELPKVKLNLSSMNEFLNRENVGEYNVRVELLKGDDSGNDNDSSDVSSQADDKEVISCFSIGMSIDEVREKSDE